MVAKKKQTVNKRTKTRVKNMQKILICLADSRARGQEFMWMRSIARHTNINLGTVSWIIYRHLAPDYIEFPEADPLIEQGLKIRPIRLKDDIYDQLLEKGVVSEPKPDISEPEMVQVTREEFFNPQEE